MSDEPGRRALLGCGAACALSAACGKWIDEPLAIETGAPSKGLLSVPASRLPELTKPGGSVILHVNASDTTGRRVSVLVANTTSEGLRAYDAYCPHAQCELAWVDKDNSVVCPCHLSRFSVNGQVQHGPANADIDSYPAKLSTDGQTVLASADPGEKPLEGGELWTHYGKGVYIFTSYSWFRQLPAGAPGAYRIFANLLSAK